MLLGLWCKVKNLLPKDIPELDMKKLSHDDLKAFLDEKVARYNQPGFIENDPISIPHRYRRKQDIEIAGLFASVLAWGQRVTIINKCDQLLRMMDNDPYTFIREHKPRDLKPFHEFRHRTFNGVDTLYFITLLRWYYSRHDSLEQAFVVEGDKTIELGLIQFRNMFFSLADAPQRTRKHISSPERKSTCKRLSMYLRWMVRKDANGVDFGIWRALKPAQLVCPCDVHVERVARRLKILKRTQTDWQMALELTRNLQKLDPQDPVKYDFALFGLGVEEKWR
jgi:uncharacterized protein (TIGR02757 family)